MEKIISQRFKRERDLFFEDPVNYVEANKSSILHLLRRDIYRCMGYTIQNGMWVKNVEPIIWPGSMAVLTGIDLLGKFYAGNHNDREVGSRFIAYCKQYICSDDDAQVIYKLRNSLVHSFGLSSATYLFQVSSSRQDLVKLLHVAKTNYSYKIDLYTLWDKFEQSIEKYKQDLAKDSNLQNNFFAMFKLYGMVHPVNNSFFNQIVDSETT